MYVFCQCCLSTKKTKVHLWAKEELDLPDKCLKFGFKRNREPPGLKGVFEIG